MTDAGGRRSWAAIALALVTAAGAAAAPTAAPLAQRLSDLRAGAQPDSVEAIVGKLLPDAWAAGDSLSLQVLLLERGKTRVAYGRAGDGEPDLREAIALADRQGPATAAHEGLRYLAEACLHLGRRDEAGALLLDLERRARAAGDDYHTGKALYGRGRLLYRARQLAAADSLYSLALPHLAAAALADSADLAAVHNGLGACRVARGRPREAAVHFGRAAALARAGRSLSLEAMATNNLAGVEMTLGDPGAAVAGYRRALEIQRERGLWQQVGAPWRNLAQALVDLGRHGEARAELLAALAFCEERGFQDEAVTTGVRLAEVDLATGQLHAALGRCRELVALGAQATLESRVAASLLAAEASLALARPDDALLAIAHAETLLAGKDDYALATRLAISRASTLRELGRHQEAVAALRPALAGATAAGVARHRLPLLVGLAASWAVLGDRALAAACLDSAEGIWEDERALPTDPRWRERRSAEAQALFALRLDLALDDGDTTAAFAAAQRFKARTLLERMLGPGAELPPASAVPRPVTLDRLQREALRPGEVLLDAVVTPRHSWLFVVTQATCSVRALPPEADLAADVAAILGRFTTPFEPIDEGAVGALSASILGPPTGPAAAAVAGATTVFVCPDGALHRAPLPTILGHDDVRNLPSATILAVIRARGPRGASPVGILAVAGEENAARRHLAGAAAEVASLRRRFRDVTVAAELVAGRHGILHLACHAEVDPDRPWNSALVLGTAAQPVRVRAGEVAGLEFAAQLAVLSSCESAGGEVLAGEGVLGLAAGFLSAGVPSVVATLWPVDDAATARFMAAFYDALADGASSAAALAAARAGTRDDGVASHPYYWAGFVLVGEGGAAIPLRTRPTLAPWVVGVALAGAVAGTVRVRQRRRSRGRYRGQKQS